MGLLYLYLYAVKNYIIGKDVEGNRFGITEALLWHSLDPVRPHKTLPEEAASIADADCSALP